MFGLLLPSGLAVALALALGGSFAGWRRACVQWWPAAVGAFGLEFLLFSPALNQQPWALVVGAPIWVAARMVLLGVLLRNVATTRQARLAWSIAAVGVGLNTLVIVLNDGHMPESASAAVAVWGPASAAGGFAAERLDNVSRLDAASSLGWLSDTLPEPTWLPRPNVVSPGDLLLSVGMAGWLFRLTRPDNSGASP